MNENINDIKVGEGMMQGFKGGLVSGLQRQADIAPP